MRTPYWLRAIAAVALAFSCRSPAAAQSAAAGAQRHTIDSRILNEKRTIDVTLPTGYGKNTAARYPVVVALDGEFEGDVASAIAHFYSDAGSIPDVIVVAVHNTDRSRDLTPAALPGFSPPPGSHGGADNFLAFLETELLPFVDRTYRTAPMRVLIGHSLGGLFALHALAKRTDLFTGYIVMEPSSWWNREQPLVDARSALKRPAARRARVMLVNAQSLTDDTTSWGGTRPMVRQIRVRDETHASMAAIGIAMALRRIFEDFRTPQWQPGTAPLAMLTRYDSLSARVGYAVPISEETFATVARMSLDARLFDDAQVALDRMEKALGSSSRSQMLRTRLQTERNEPTPAGFIPLVVPARRPTPAQAARFIGRWQSIDAPDPHQVEVRASGDTIVVRDSIAYPEGEPFVGDDPVIQVTEAGELEWGLPFFRGLAALLVNKARIVGDIMEVRREARGWLPKDPNFRVGGVIRYRRLGT